MSYRHTFVVAFSHNGQTVTSTTEQVDASGESNIDETIGISADNLQLNIAIDVSALQSIFMLATTDMTVATNDLDSGAPDDVFNLVANQPLIWTTNSLTANPFASGVDVTDVRVSNGAVAGTLQIYALQDATP